MDSSFLSRADIGPDESQFSESLQIYSSRFALNAMTTIRWDFLQDVLSYQEAGVNAIGLWRNKLDQFGVEKGIELLKEKEIEVSSLSWAGSFTGSHGLSFVDAVEDGLHAIDLANSLGSKTLIVVSGAQGNHIDSHVNNTVVEGLQWLAGYAAEKNVTLSILPMHRSFKEKWTFLNSIDSTLDVIDSCNHQNVKLAFSTYQMGCENKIQERISSIIDYIDIVQIADCKTEPSQENDRCLPGEGILPVAELVTELIQNGYENYFEFDIWSRELWKSDYSELITSCQSGFMDLLTSREPDTSRVFS